MKKLLLAASSTLLLTACGQSANEAAEDRVEETAETSATAAGPAEIALGLSEAQLLDADIIGPNNVELGDVISLMRGGNGAVEGFLVEVEDSDPDRFVQVPIAGLTVVTRGDDRDLATSMTKAQFLALPQADLTAR